MSKFSIRTLFKRNEDPQEGVRYIFLDETNSTSDYLKSLLATLDGVEKVPRLTVACADYQTAGRGQGSNKWVSERGKNLLFSILCHPVWVPVQSQFLISEALALALRDSLAAYADGITVKWPNDIYWNDCKISGTIIECSLHGGRMRDCITGTGVNVNQQAFGEGAPNPVSLCQIVGHDVDRTKLLKDIVGRFDAYLADIRNGSYGKIAGLYASCLYRGSGFFPFRDRDGDFEAAVVEVEDDGRLVLRDRGGHIRIYAFKEVEFVK